MYLKVLCSNIRSTIHNYFFKDYYADKQNYTHDDTDVFYYFA